MALIACIIIVELFLKDLWASALHVGGPPPAPSPLRILMATRMASLTINIGVIHPFQNPRSTPVLARSLQLQCHKPSTPTHKLGLQIRNG